MASEQNLTAYLPLSAIPAGPAVGSARATPRATLDDIADPTKVANQSLSFGDFLSAINPLQHIPIVGTIYRAITGDTLSPTARVVGGTLLGGPLGLIASAANAIIEQATGKDIGDQVLAMFSSGKHDGPDDIPAVAAADAAVPAVSDAAPTIEAPAAAAPSSATTDSTLVAQRSPGADEAKDKDDAGNDAAAAAVIAAAAPIAPGAPTPAAPSRTPVTSGATPPGRTLAQYWASAGHKLPSGGGSASAAAPQRAPIPLQVSVPGPADVRHMPIVAAASGGAAPVDAAQSPEKPGSDWVAAAMMQGLDRYRQMKIREDTAQPSRVDQAL